MRILDGKESLNTALLEDLKGVFFKEVKTLIKEASKGTLLNPKNDQKYTEGTLTCWTKTMNKLKEYLPELTFDVTLEDYNTFKLKCQEAGLSNSYIRALIKDWKTFMKHTENKELHNNQVTKLRTSNSSLKILVPRSH